MLVLTRLASAFRVRPGEGQLVTLFLLHSFFVGVNRVFVLAVSTSTFLTAFGADALPVVYIFTAVANGLFGLLYSALGRRISFSRVLAANLIIQLVSLVGFWLVFNLTKAEWPALIFMILVELLWLLTSLAFWPLAGRVFNIQQGKRLFGLIGSGDTIASMIGGFAVPTIVAFTGTYNLLLLAAASSAASLLIIIVIVRQFRGQIEDDASSSQSQTLEPFRVARRTRYVTVIFAVSAIATIVYYFLDNLFYGLTETQFADTESLAGFFGFYFATVSLVQFLAQSFLAGWLVNRVGVVICIVLTPLIVTLLMAAVALSGTLTMTLTITFFLMAFVRLVDYVLRDSVMATTTMTIYQSLPPRLRFQTQTRVEGLIEPLTTGVAGFLLLVLGDVLGLRLTDVIAFTILLLLVWVVLAYLLSREYPKALVQALSKRRLGNTNFTLQGQGIVGFIQARLADADTAEILYLLHLLQDTDSDSLIRLLPGLLNHPEASVRAEALRYVAQFNVTSSADSIQLLLADNHYPDVQAAALRAAMSIKPETATSQALNAVNAPESSVQRAAIVSLMQRGGDVARLAQRQLLTLLDSDVPARRSLAARILGELGDLNFHRQLLRLLNDNELEVRRAALAAAHDLRDPRLWPSIIENLAVKKVRSDALFALSTADETIFPLLAETLNEIRHELETGFSARASIARTIVRVCDRLKAIFILSDNIDFPDAAVRDQVLTALVNNRFHTPDKEHVESRMIQEMTDTLWYLQGRRLLSGNALLSDALDHILEQARRRLFGLCAAIYDSQTMIRAMNDYFARSEQQRSYALEVLHIHLPRELKQRVTAFMDDVQMRYNFDELLESADIERLERDRWLSDLLTNPRALLWLKVCALYGIASDDLVDLLPLIELTLADSRMVIRETAEWVIDQFQGRDTGAKKMLLTVEKVLLLKSVSLFSHVPDTLLLEIASIVRDEHAQEDETILNQGDLGDCMYVIVNGRVRVHDEEQTFAQLADSDVFGELALLDAEPRAASVTALEETYLLRLDQETFYELIADYPEVLRGIIRVLSQRLRDANRRTTPLPGNQPAHA